MAITGDDIGKGVLGLIFTFVVAAVGWLLKTVFKLKEDVLGGQLKHTHLEAKVDEIKTNELTRECVREEIELALDKRDKTAEQRNMERAALRKLEMKEIVQDALAQAVPKIVREVRGSTGVNKRPPRDGDSE